ncbi:cytochrome c [Planctomicrobium sp. SH668]|uniref:cytochrome c n=1 Tax=Planctomicrobium sp. SH668 TaxID=3448126 RepID=UPI003F5BD881
MRTFYSIVAILTLASGCSSKPEFAHRKEFEKLEPYAQNYISAVLESYFGTPTELVVWDKLPLKKNLANGVVSKASAEELVLELAEPHPEITPGTEIIWSSGSLKGQAGAWVKSFDESTHTAILSTPLKTLPEVGTEVIVGPGKLLANGRELYTVHCVHCHGITGDGYGPTAEYLNPLPRDYRKGIFKFTLTQAQQRANRDDLARILDEGVPGTYMPSFKLLTPDETQAIVEYVLWLSMRGETEYQLVRYFADEYSKEVVAEMVKEGLEDKKSGEEKYDTAESIRAEFVERINDPEDLPVEVSDMIELMLERWEEAELPESLVTPEHNRVPYSAESIARGRLLYQSVDLNCVACHGAAGYGDGPQTQAITRDIDTGKENPLPGLYDSWGEKIPPRNLHDGIFRGGRRPIDLYARLHAGIKGTPMPAFGGKLKDEELWDLVNYIYSVPFESNRAGIGHDPGAPEAAGDDVAAH